MMSDPVEDLSATVVQDPAPILVYPGRAVGRPGRRTQPAVIVQRGRRGAGLFLTGGTAEIGVTLRQAYLDLFHPSDPAIAYQLAGKAEITARSLPAAGLPDPV